MLTLVAAAHLAVLIIAALRLSAGRPRRAPVPPRPEGLDQPRVTVVVPTLNEADRIGPCLRGLAAQALPVDEIIIVDSGSTDGTRERIAAAMQADPRFRLEQDPPLPHDWVGKAWALQHGIGIARNELVVTMDADTEAVPGCVAAVVAAADAGRLDLVSFAPRFDGQTAGERWLQPALLVSLILRGDSPGASGSIADRVLANGQCMVVRKRTFLAHGGFAPVRDSFAEDVSLARHLARAGARVDFLDGSRLYRVRSYANARQMWREWGRSFDLKDATPRVRRLTDALVVLGAQGLTLPVAIALALQWGDLDASLARTMLATSIGVLLALRWILLYALAPSYERRGLTWWLSPFADPLAALRLLLSLSRRPRSWRGRAYGQQSTSSISSSRSSHP